ncbi:hypothetical protein LWI29_016539 [Acer saccharum]|uniref:Uncharacterized protein n=1 Tax=Acer saccharum TaxID=4024 RepID=A0AA39S3R6_ACESA|nr:hypothetical protein LWI29_016539 [Acer saccharum]
MWLSFAGGVGLLFSLTLFICSWPLRLIISGCVLVIPYLMFLLATRSYHKKEAAHIAQKPFACIRVVWAAILNHHMEYPSSLNHFFHYNNDELELWPQAKLLKWIDKAAIIESTLGQEAQEKAGRLCDVRMVQETKYILKMVPVWSCFIVFGLVLSTANTLSSFEGIKLESANQFLIYLILIQSLARGLVSSKLSPLCLLSNWFPKAKLKKNMMRIWGGMVISILYSAIAWWVEVHRLHIFDKYHSFSHHHYDYDISLPMSIWWLAPQYLLLGLMEGLATEGLEHFTNDDEHLSRSMKTFLSAINVFVITGIGSALNILCIYSNKKLFHLTLSDSRLDLYYKYFTMYVTPLNCVYLMMISIFIYGGSEVAQVNEALGIDTAQVNQESMPETTVPDATSLAC